jgi:hypothetical protein
MSEVSTKKPRAPRKPKAQKPQVTEKKPRAPRKPKAQKPQKTQVTEKKPRAPRKPKQKTQTVLQNVEVKVRFSPLPPQGSVKDSTAAWNLRKPQTTRDRAMLASKCGQTKCFLYPEELKYPICGKDMSCDVDCDGVRAAYNLTAMQTNMFKNKPALLPMVEQAKKRAKETGSAHCGWSS